MTEVSNPETIHSAVKALSLLRSTIGDLFKHMVNAPQLNLSLSEVELQQGKDTYSNQLDAIVNHLNNRFRELEAACTLLNPMVSNINLGNTSLVGLDPNYDKTSLYPDMIISYRWLDNMQEYSSFAFQALSASFTKRNSMAKSRQTVSRNRMNHNNHSIPPATIDFLAAQMQRSFDISIEVVRPFGVFSVLKIVLDRTLRAVIVLRGFVIQWVLIKGFEETFEEMNPANLNKLEKRHPHPYMPNMADMNIAKLDIWTPSRHQIFRTITDHANAAILHFYAPLQMESAIKAFTNWIKSYSNLFSAKCRKCDSRIMNNMPPTWRDFRTNEPYHFECRP